MTGRRRPSVPEGYECFTTRGGTTVVARGELVPALAEALGEGSLYEYAARHPRARTMAGRGAVYAIPLAGLDGRVVVRRSRRGGLLAPITGDRFVIATRAASELRIALRLASEGVATPDVLAYAVYRAGPLLRRSDVVTREVPRGRDLATALLNATEAAKGPMLAATAVLLNGLARVGARHHDLNLKNILLSPSSTGALQAYVLDVDRITFGAPGSHRIARANLSRFGRSAQKWRELYGARIDEADVAWLSGAAQVA